MSSIEYELVKKTVSSFNYSISFISQEINKTVLTKKLNKQCVNVGFASNKYKY